MKATRGLVSSWSLAWIVFTKAKRMRRSSLIVHTTDGVSEAAVLYAAASNATSAQSLTQLAAIYTW